MAKEASPKNKKESTEYKIIEHLKPFCDGCKPATLKSYARNIRRLAKFAGLKSVPHNKGWLDGAKGKTLRNKINKETNLFNYIRNNIRCVIKVVCSNFIFYDRRNISNYKSRKKFEHPFGNFSKYSFRMGKSETI